MLEPRHQSLPLLSSPIVILGIHISFGTGDAMPISGRVCRIIGWVLSGLLAALYAFSASGKLTGNQQAMEGFEKFGLADWRIIIGIGEVCSVILFLIPRTAVAGTLLLSAYMGGAIVTHMQHGESIILPSLVLVVVWIAAGLRLPELSRTLIQGKA
jgi:hypothetical protein